MSGHKDVIGLLLNKKADVHRVNNFNETALRCAVDNNRREIVELLRDVGENPSQKHLRRGKVLGLGLALSTSLGVVGWFYKYFSGKNQEKAVAQKQKKQR